MDAFKTLLQDNSREALFLGGLLIAGLFTRLASLAGGGLLMMFYLAIPPLPGTPPEAGVLE